MSSVAEPRKVVIVTGASSGIGLACAARLWREGYAVYGTARSMPSEELGRSCPGLVQLKVDVTREDSVRGMVEEVARAEGRIDALVNNAGYGLSGAAEETELEEARAQLDTNFLGYVRAVRA
ncbi:MAG TPA: SDR family NAD(P)-dependent oxidoreductase, partial [Myxococcaceae bacterium]